MPEKSHSDFEEAWGEANRVVSRIQGKVDELLNGSFQWGIAQGIPTLPEYIKRNAEVLQDAIIASIVTGLENLDSSTIQERIEYLRLIFLELQSRHLRDSLPRGNTDHLPFLPILTAIEKLIENQDARMPLARKLTALSRRQAIRHETPAVSIEWAEELGTYLENRKGGVENTKDTLDAIATLILDKRVVVHNAKSDLYGEVDLMISWKHAKDNPGDDIKTRRVRVLKRVNRYLSDALIPIPDSPDNWNLLAHSIRHVIKAGDWSSYFLDKNRTKTGQKRDN